jgi:hypothetical protein
MLPTTSTGTGGGEGSRAPDAVGDRGGEAQPAASAPRVESPPEREGAARGDGANDRGANIPAGDDDRGAGRSEEGAGNPPPNRTRIPRADFIRTVKACEGNFSLAARVLGIDVSSVRSRVERIPELHALYGNRSEDATVPPPPTEGSTLLRNPGQLAAPIPAADLGQMVQVTEKLLNGGLEKLGVPKATIEKLRDLSELRIDAGAMLAVSLQDTHQLYYLQLLSLAARADEIYNKYLKTDDEKVEKMDPMARMFWQRAHTEIIEQLGKGYDRMMAGTQAMVTMLKAGKDKNKAPENKVDAGWEMQVPKSVAKTVPRS